MQKDYESLYHSEEDTNWWFVARRDMLLKLFRKYKIRKDASILDIGCASGTFLVQLKQNGFTNGTALDYSAEAIEQCKKRGIAQAYVMDGHKPEFPDESFDVIIASDSLEHLQHDEVALQNWYKVLKKGGTCIIYVPAYNFLWTKHDDVNYHFRRYTRSMLKGKVKKAGFKIISAGYWNVLLFIPVAIVRLLSKLKGKKKDGEADTGDLVHLPSIINNTLIGWMKVENTLSRHISFPFGISTYVVLTK